jgi:isochorismate hydrolase
MTTLVNRPNTALLIVDVQNGVVREAYERGRIVANIVTLLDKARTAGVDVVWVQHNNDELTKGSDSWQYVRELVRRESEPLVQKEYGDAFEESDLESTLAGLGIGRLFVAGAQTDECIRATLHGAIVRGYDAILVEDAHTTDDLSSWGAPTPEKVIAHTNLYWGNHRAPGRVAGTVSTADVSIRLLWNNLPDRESGPPTSYAEAASDAVRMARSGRGLPH